MCAVTWRVDEVLQNVHTITFDNISSGWEQYILLTSDRHHDNAHSNNKLELKHLAIAKERNAPIIDIGDLFCAMQGKYDKRKSQDALRPEHRTDDYFGALLDTAESFYAPYANLFTVLGTGNHETSVLKHNNLDLTKMLSRRLSRHASHQVYKGGYGGYVLIKFNINGTQRRSVRLRYFHGSGGGGAVTKGVIQTNRRAVMFPDADIVVTGHIHEAWYVAIPRERLNRHGVIKHETQHHISVPTYKEEYGTGSGGYHIEKGRPPKPIGCTWLRFYVHNGHLGFDVLMDIL